MDERIDKMADDVSYMRGRFDSHLKFQEQIDSRLSTIQSNHAKRIDKLESQRDSLWGFIAASTVGGGGIGAFLMKLFGHG